MRISFGWEPVRRFVSPVLRHIPFYSGNTILGDGSVVMILDPNGIAQTIGQSKSGSSVDEAAKLAKGTTQGERTSFLTSCEVANLLVSLRLRVVNS